MGIRTPQVDRYIATSAPFAQPILAHIRDVMHAACPDVVEEIKWSFPFFTYKSEIVCAMRAFKAHCGLFFWKGKLVVPDGKEEGMGQFGKLTSVRELPSKAILTGYVKTAMQLNEAGVQAPHVAAQRAKAKKTAAKPIVIPPELAAALKQNKKAAAAFEQLAPSHRREYATWIADAKREETRATRVEKAVALIAQGKSQNWQYDARQKAKPAAKKTAKKSAKKTAKKR